MSEQENLLEAARASARAEERFFSNAAKVERELWVAREFLSILKVPFNDSELISTPQYSDADILFRDARFQIKEIPDPAILRGAELKARRLRVEAATCVEDLLEPAEAHDIILSNAYLLILDRATTQRYAPAVKASLDLLCYVTRPYSGLGTKEEQRQLADTGWRSISCLYGSRALVLARSANAPTFLRANVTGHPS